MNQGTSVALWQMSMREYMCKITINQEDEVVGQGIGTRPPNKEQMKTTKNDLISI